MAENDKEKITPLMKQYNAMKAKYPDTILLYRVGDFYETFEQDAVETSKILDIVLTNKGNGAQTKLAGFPYHALDTYLPRFIKAGRKVAVCEQMEDPKLAKGIVKREVTEVVTPGISCGCVSEQNNRNNFLCAIHRDKDCYGVAFIDINTGEFFVCEGKEKDIKRLLQNFMPSEIVLQKHEERNLESLLPKEILTKVYDDWVFSLDFAKDTLSDLFDINSFKGFGIEKMPLACIAAGACIHYIHETNHKNLAHICNISRIDDKDYVWMDEFTIRNLELIQLSDNKQHSLFSVLNKTQSNMGARLLNRWIVFPLKDRAAILKRQNIVGSLIYNDELRETVTECLSLAGDVDRRVSRLAIGRINPNELYHFTDVIEAVQRLKKAIENAGEEKKLYPVLDELKDLQEIIVSAIDPQAPNNIAKGGAIKPGFDKDLDYYRHLVNDSKGILDGIRNKEAENTGINTLKIGYNNVFGYFLEVTNSNKDEVPQEWIRKQTLANNERYITSELKEVESSILSAQENISSLESELYQRVVSNCVLYVERLQTLAKQLAVLDCLLSFAIVATEKGYTRPEIVESESLHISQGRHPIIEKVLPKGEKYIANDVYLDSSSQQIMIITGPNMSGKSAYLRQTALIVIMAQMGSFIPAKFARIGIVDKIFTRVGASDNIATGESTFMVEMNETASILNNLSSRSLILLDEIGRGTSTYDGVSIAWAVAAYLHENKYKAKVLFATHYHELIAMQEKFSRLKNYHVSVKELGSKVIFTRKIEQGGCSESFGIHVAKLAGMPRGVLSLAEKILESLEQTRTENIEVGTKEEKKDGKQDKTAKKTTENLIRPEIQTSFIRLNDPILEQIKEDIVSLDIENLTPIQALNKLNEIKDLVKKI